MADEMTLDEYREALKLILKAKLEEADAAIPANREDSYAISARIELLEELIEII